jgi:ribose 5-phosphate isomerase B
MPNPRLIPSVHSSVYPYFMLAAGGRMRRIAVASDHAGYELKVLIAAHLRSKGYTVDDFGTVGVDPVDYPDFIGPAAASVAAGENDAGIVLGGSGNGEAIVANKVRGIRCAVCWNVESGRLAKEHNNANMISIGARLVNKGLAIKIVDAWLNAEFQGGRHERRIRKIE